MRNEASGNHAGTLAGEVAGGRDVQQPLPDYGDAEVTPNAKLRGASRLHGEASLSNDVLGAAGPREDK